MIVMLLVGIIGCASATLYLRRRQWIEALLILLAAAGLAGMVGGFTMPVEGKKMTVSGDGMRAAQWDDLPAQPFEWKAPADPVLRLDFARRLPLGRMFTLTLTHDQAASRRLQLLAENDQILADAAGSGKALTVQWLPPVAEAMVLKARLLDGAGKVVAEGPIPIEVTESAPLRVEGRFGSPSFDARTLNELLAGSGAVIDWQVTLGKTVSRTEAARAAAEPNLLVVDAAWLERLGEGARGAMLAKVAAGTPLMILGGNASDTAFWSRIFQLQLKTNTDDKASGAPLAMPTAPFVPAGPLWRGNSDRLWTRSWEKGRIVWIGVSDWHKYAISEPRALGLWWQDVLDTAGVRQEGAVQWLPVREMPLPGQRMGICAVGVTGQEWQRRAEHADALCKPVWPEKAGWLDIGSGKTAGREYVYAPGDWPLWQKAQKRDATAMYAGRTVNVQKPQTTPLPAWPFAALFALGLLGLWWRERR